MLYIKILDLVFWGGGGGGGSRHKEDKLFSCPVVKVGKYSDPLDPLIPTPTPLETKESAENNRNNVQQWMPTVFVLQISKPATLPYPYIGEIIPSPNRLGLQKCSAEIRIFLHTKIATKYLNKAAVSFTKCEH